VKPCAHLPAYKYLIYSSGHFALQMTAFGLDAFASKSKYKTIKVI